MGWDNKVWGKRQVCFPKHLLLVALFQQRSDDGNHKIVIKIIFFFYAYTAECVRARYDMGTVSFSPHKQKHTLTHMMYEHKAHMI